MKRDEQSKTSFPETKGQLTNPGLLASIEILSKAVSKNHAIACTVHNLIAMGRDIDEPVDEKILTPPSSLTARILQLAAFVDKATEELLELRSELERQ